MGFFVALFKKVWQRRVKRDRGSDKDVVWFVLHLTTYSWQQRGK